MGSHTQDILYAIATILPIIAFIWQINKSQMEKIDKRFAEMETRFEKRFEQIEKRFDKIEERLTRIEQNHLDHMTALHSLPVIPQTPIEITNKENT